MKVNLQTKTTSPRLPSEQVFITRLRESLTEMSVEWAMLSQELVRWLGRLPDDVPSEAYWLDRHLGELIAKCEAARRTVAVLTEISSDPVGAWLMESTDEVGGKPNW